MTSPKISHKIPSSVSSIYNTLWCHKSDEEVVTLHNNMIDTREKHDYPEDTACNG